MQELLERLQAAKVAANRAEQALKLAEENYDKALAFYAEKRDQIKAQTEGGVQ